MENNDIKPKKTIAPKLIESKLIAPIESCNGNCSACSDRKCLKI